MPDVYWIITGSVGLTSGSAILWSSPAAMKVSQSSNEMTSRNSGQRGATSMHRFQHRIAAERRHHEDAGRAGLLQHIFDLVGPKTRIDGDQHHPGHRGAELHHHPFRQIIRPDGDPLARLEAAEQGARGALRLGVKLRIRPLAARRGVGDTRNQREPVRRRPRGLLQQLAERDVADGGGNTRDVRFLQGHCLSHGVFAGTMPICGN